MKSILLIDDNSPVRESLSALLALKGYRVLAAEDGEQGLALHSKLSRSEEPPDLVITDLSMPGIGGFAVIRTLLSQRSETKIIALSGNSSLEKALRLGARFAFGKPFAPQKLLDAIQQLLTPDDQT